MRDRGRLDPTLGRPSGRGEGTGAVRRQPTVGSQSPSLEMCHLHMGPSSCKSLVSFLPLGKNSLGNSHVSQPGSWQTQSEGPGRHLSREAISLGDSVALRVQVPPSRA